LTNVSGEKKNCNKSKNIIRIFVLHDVTLFHF